MNINFMNIDSNCFQENVTSVCRICIEPSLSCKAHQKVTMSDQIVLQMCSNGRCLYLFKFVQGRSLLLTLVQCLVKCYFFMENCYSVDCLWHHGTFCTTRARSCNFTKIGEILHILLQLRIQIIF